jgi:putative colanic acid biosynthesis UDP-glucose lipid carrier transferase
MLPSRHIHQQLSLLGPLYRGLDAACVAVGLWLAVGFGGSRPANYLLPGAVAIIGYYLVAEISGLYRSWRGASGEREAFCTLFTWAATFTLLAALGYACGELAEYSRRTLGIWLLMAPLLMILTHGFLRSIKRSLWLRGINTKSLAVVGVTPLGFELARNIQAMPDFGLKLAGFYDDRPPERNPQLPPGLRRQIGGLDDLVADARAGFVDCIYITFPMRAEDRIRGALAKLADTTASVYIVPDFYVFQLLHSRWTDIGGIPAVSVFESPLYGVDGLVKRLFDLLAASAILFLFSLPLAIIALAVKLTSRGPILFRQLRYGLDGNEIWVWKFRSMHVCENGPRVAQATKDDPRVTRLGAFLRRTSLDELPQLFNVLEGTMSLVGPRPHATAHNEQYRTVIQGYMLRHKVKPGITGLAQVRGWRGETDTLEKMQRRIECDHEYIREWSLWLDIKILFRTLFVVLKRQNAY